jgi:hypothetical protein
MVATEVASIGASVMFTGSDIVKASTVGTAASSRFRRGGGLRSALAARSIHFYRVAGSSDAASVRRNAEKFYCKERNNFLAEAICTHAVFVRQSGQSPDAPFGDRDLSPTV